MKKSTQTGQKGVLKLSGTLEELTKLVNNPELFKHLEACGSAFGTLRFEVELQLKKTPEEVEQVKLF